MNGIEVKEGVFNDEFQSKYDCKAIDEANDLLWLLVTDAMQRESAIADDYWRETFQNGKKDQTEVSLKQIERQ